MPKQKKRKDDAKEEGSIENGENKRIGSSFDTSDSEAPTQSPDRSPQSVLNNDEANDSQSKHQEEEQDLSDLSIASADGDDENLETKLPIESRAARQTNKNRPMKQGSESSVTKPANAAPRKVKDDKVDVKIKAERTATTSKNGPDENEKGKKRTVAPKDTKDAKVQRKGRAKALGPPIEPSPTTIANVAVPAQKTKHVKFNAGSTTTSAPSTVEAMKQPVVKTAEVKPKSGRNARAKAAPAVIIKVPESKKMKEKKVAKAAESKSKTAKMVREAITKMGDKDGLGLRSIKKYLQDHFDIDSKSYAVHIRKYLKKAFENGELVQAGNASFNIHRKFKIGNKPAETKMVKVATMKDAQKKKLAKKASEQTAAPKPSTSSKSTRTIQPVEQKEEEEEEEEDDDLIDDDDDIDSD